MSLAQIAAEMNPWWREPSERLAQGFPFRRDIHRELLRRVLNVANRRAVVFAGPRQIGKTVLLRQLVDDLLDRDWPATNITYFDFSDYRLADTTDPGQLLRLPEIGASPKFPRVLLLDEISLAFHFDLWLKQLVDWAEERYHPAGLRIVATDSSASLLHRATRDSGLGRWDQLPIGSLTFSEFLRMSSGAKLEAAEVLRTDPGLLGRYLAIGGFPKHILEDPASTVRARLREEIIDGAVRRDLERLGEVDERAIRLFVWFVQESGSILNKDSRAADLNADARTVEKWLGWLQEMALLLGLEQQTGKKAAGRLRGKPKIFAADHGLVTAFAAAPPEASDVRAKVFETVVFRHLRELLTRPEAHLTYFRLSDQLELDFLLETPTARVGVEVTSSRGLDSDRRARLTKVAEQLGLSSVYFVHGGLAHEPLEAKRGVSIRPLPLPSFLLDPAQILEAR